MAYTYNRKQKRIQLKAATVYFVIFLQNSEEKQNASVFRHALNAQMEQWADNYIELTMPTIL